MNTKKPGFLLIDKPVGITSHDVIDRLRKITGIKKIGHAGTLDPFASGLLLVAIDRKATREISQFVGLDKIYEAIFLLGAKSETDDPEGPITKTNAAMPDKITIENELKNYLGSIEQLPPKYAAIKVGGKKMYELARNGREVPQKPRLVKIYKYDLVSYAPPEVKVKIHCSSGTYIRSLARDLGKKLGTGAYVKKLRRLAIGPFIINEAITLNKLTTESWAKNLLPIEHLNSRIAKYKKL